MASASSARWRRVLLERLDAVAVIYRLASAISNTAYPVRFRWYRAMPLDAAVTLPGGGTIGIVRQGPATDRTGFTKRLWRLRGGPLPGAVLMLMSDEVRLRHARRFLARTTVPALFALEREAVAAAPDDPVWRLRSVNAALGLRAAIDRMDRRGALPAEQPLARGATLPPDIDEHAPGGDAPDYLLPALLRPAEKRALDLLADWPWLGLRDLAGLLGVSRPRESQLTAALEGFGLVVRAPASGRRLALTDLGLAMLARRDRAAVGGARKRWSAAPIDAGEGTGAASPAGAADSSCATWSTPPQSTASSRPWRPRPATWAGRSTSSTRPSERPATSGTSAGCARSTPTPSACCAGARRPGPSS